MTPSSLNRPILIPTWLAWVIVALLSGLSVAAISTIPGAPSALPSGAIVLSAADCPTGTTEYTAARGRMIVGVPAAGTIVGTVGTAMTDTQNLSVTPTFTGSAGTVPAQVFTGSAGTVPAQVFTGSALATHSHETNLAGGITNLSVFDTYGTGTSGARIGYFAGTSETSTIARHLTQSVSGGTPAGTNGTAAFTPAGTNGTAAFTPAGTNSAVTGGGIAPYIQMRVCQQ